MPRRATLTAAIAHVLLIGTAKAATITVDSTFDAPPADDGTCTLREAIENANTDSQNGRTSPGECAAGQGIDEIDFDAGVFGSPQIISLSQGEMTITESVDVIGPGQALLTIDANSNSRHFLIDDSDSVTASDVSIADLRLIQGAVAGQRGGAIECRENLTLSQVTLADNAVTSGGSDPYLGRGGGLSVDARQRHGVTVALAAVQLESNQARNGGGLALDLDQSSSPSTVTITDSSIVSNTAATPGTSSVGQAGGLISAGENASITITDTLISGNYGDTIGNARVGGLSIAAKGGSQILLERVEVLDNVANVSDDGSIGGLQMRLVNIGDSPSSMVLRASTISGNETVGGIDGGLAFSAQGPGDFRIESSTISGNSAEFARGGASLEAYGATIQLINSTVSGNTSGLGGGGLGLELKEPYYSGTLPSRIEITQSTIAGNTAAADPGDTQSGGGVFVTPSSAGELLIERSIIAANTDQSTGSRNDLVSNGLPIEMTFSLLSDNTASGFSEAPLGSPDANGNLIGDPGGAGRIDPLLNALGNNGGNTQSHEPQNESPAIDAAGPCAGSDQRGLDRPQGPACDMGSVEVESFDDLFRDRFETGVRSGRPFRLAWIHGKDVEALADGSPRSRLAMLAREVGGGTLRQTWAEIRGFGDTLELRLAHFQRDRILLGQWAAVDRSEGTLPQSRQVRSR